MTVIKKTLQVILLLTLLTLITVHGMYQSAIDIRTEQTINGSETSVNVTQFTLDWSEAVDSSQMSLLLPEGFKSNRVSLGRIDPDTKTFASFRVQVDPNMLPGVYSIAILEEFVDAKGYKDSRIMPSYLVIKESHSSQVSAKISSPIVIGDKENTTKIMLSLQNHDYKDHEVKIRIFAPLELKVNPTEKDISLKGGDNATTDFEITLFGDLPGPRYGLFASVGYEDEGIHYSSNTESQRVSVAGDELEQGKTPSITWPLPSSITGMIILAAGVCVVLIIIIFLALYFRAKPSKTSGGKRAQEESRSKGGENKSREDQYRKENKESTSAGARINTHRNTYYAVLKVKPDANQEEIKVAYRKLAKAMHPDHLPNTPEDTKKLLEEQLKEVNEAYRVLGDIDKRREYDNSLRGR